MVTWTKKVRQGENESGPLYYHEGFSLSRDELPTDSVANGSNSLQMDTGEVMVYDQDVGAWSLLGESATPPPPPPPPVEIVSWADGTDDQIAAMVEALDAGTISIEDTGWEIGDEREIALSSMGATGVEETHAPQYVVLVLMDSQHYDLVDGGKDHFVVGMKDCLKETGYMNSTHSNIGSWDGCARRSWCNNVFRNAIPATLRGCFKQFHTVTAKSYNVTELAVSNDYFALFAEKEIFGTRTNSNEDEAFALTQIEYYKTAANRIKKVNGSVESWWQRSPYFNSNTAFCLVYKPNGTADTSGAAAYKGLAPFGCI